MNALAALLTLILAGGALAEGSAPDLTLTPQKPLSRSIDAYPRIAFPATAETAKVNDALTKGDARVKNAARDCNHTEADNATQWRRTVSVPFRYGDFLTVMAADEWACATFNGSFLAALTYDLKTGDFVDWDTLFPPRIAGDPAQGSAGDTTKLSLMASPILNEVYRRKVLLPMSPQERYACTDGFASDHTLMLWLDAEHEGVAMRGFGFPRASEACAQQVVLTMDELTLLRAEPRLLEAIKAAHAAHAWSDDIRPGARPKPAASR